MSAVAAACRSGSEADTPQVTRTTLDDRDASPTSTRSRSVDQQPTTTGDAAATDFAPDARIEMNVLVVSDWKSDVDPGSVSGMLSQLEQLGVPTTVVRLRDADRPRIDAAFLGDATTSSFAAIVLPNDDGTLYQDPRGLASEELAAIHDAQKRYGIRMAGAYSWPTAELGLQEPFYSGPGDGRTVEVTEAARAEGGPFSYLDGTFQLDDFSKDGETWMFASELTPGSRLEPLLTTTDPETGKEAVLFGRLTTSDGRKVLVSTFASNQWMVQSDILGRGWVDELLQGTYLGAGTNSLVLDIDDVGSENDLWDQARDCTPDATCPAERADEPKIRMTEDDLQRLLAWQEQTGFQMNLAYNGRPFDEAVQENGSDPLLDAVIANKERLRLINHTFTHRDLDDVDQQTIEGEIVRNLQWAQSRGLSVSSKVVVPGEHSGFRSLPDTTEDNPEMLPALQAVGVQYGAIDASREGGPRLLAGGDTPTPTDDVVGIDRSPMFAFYMTPDEASFVDAYIDMYTTKADGGMGICEGNEKMTCIEPPTDPAAFFNQILDTEARMAMSRIMSNGSPIGYMHQGNLMWDGDQKPLAITFVDEVLRRYEGVFSENAPLLNPTFIDAAMRTHRMLLWNEAVDAGRATAYIQDGQLVVEVAPDAVPLDVPVTAPTDATVGDHRFGDDYAGSQQAWITIANGQQVVVQLGS